MAKQNIYDNEEFFDGYKKLRENKASANILFEMPALYSLLPELTGKSVLDLGCGFGEHCVEYVRRGADRVVGLDISEKMLAVAKKENADPHIEYIRMPMEEIDKLEGPFDLVISSLAFHYVEDFGGVLKNIYRLLREDGLFIFSQENPLSTCYSGNTDRWTRDAQGNKLYANIADYGVEGERDSTWFVDGVKKYHRTFSTIINTIADTGFRVEKLIEPRADEELLRAHPEQADLRHKPDFLLIRAGKGRDGS